MNTRLIDMIHCAGTPTITVIGDIILDAYIQGATSRISPEAPIQILDVQEEKFALGGAANVAANLINMGARVELCGVVGDDYQGTVLMEMLKARKIGTRAVVRSNRPTINKTRVVAQNQQLIRIDREIRSALDPKEEKALLAALGPVLEGSDMVILSDYAKGVVSDAMIRQVTRKPGPDVLVDPKGRNYARYKGCRLITPNRKEAEEATGLTLDDPARLKEAAQHLFNEVGAEEVVITLGADGIYFARGNEEENLIPAESRSVYDVTGAGDTVISLIAFCLAEKFSLDDAVRIANAGAGVVVGKLGVAAPSRQELVEFFSSGSTRYMDKILTQPQAKEVSRTIQRKGEKLVFTNGCFDLVHGGHMHYLRAAKALGDYLMVGVNSDDSVKRLKGEKRPILSLEERMEILACLQMVDFVVSFSEDTPAELIRTVSPQILIKGEDWKEKGVVGREWVESHGGEVSLLPLRPGYSTTSVIHRVRERYGKDSS